MSKFLCKWGYLVSKKPLEIRSVLPKSLSTMAIRNAGILQPSGESTVPNIPDFYKNKSIFITGATGFIGKVLVERLLATCPDIGKLFLLVRDRKGVTVDQRLRQLKDCELFDVLRAKSPQQLDKIVAVSGDISRTQFGLAPDDQAQLEEVSVVFHVAASMRMEEPLRAAVNSNLRSTIELLELCDRLPNMEVFVYVSTCYSNSELKRVEERIYPPPMDLKTVLDAVKHQDLDEKQTKKLTASKPNSYTFTKAMAEHVVEKHGGTNYPVAVFRPGAGEILELNSYKKHRPNQVRVYNNSNPEDESPITWGHFSDLVNQLVLKYPSKNAVWYPHYYYTNNRQLFWALQLMLHTIPNHMLQYTSRLFSINARVDFIQVNKAIREKNKVLWYFATNKWDFLDVNTKKLRKRLSEIDKARFNLDLKTIDWNKMIEIMVRGTRRHILKESDESLDCARARIRKIGYAITASKAASVLAGLTVLSCYI